MNVSDNAFKDKIIKEIDSYINTLYVKSYIAKKAIEVFKKYDGKKVTKRMVSALENEIDEEITGKLNISYIDKTIYIWTGPNGPIVYGDRLHLRLYEIDHHSQYDRFVFQYDRFVLALSYFNDSDKKIKHLQVKKTLVDLYIERYRTIEKEIAEFKELVDVYPLYSNFKFL